MPWYPQTLVESNYRMTDRQLPPCAFVPNTVYTWWKQHCRPPTHYPDEQLCVLVCTLCSGRPTVSFTMDGLVLQISRYNRNSPHTRELSTGQVVHSSCVHQIEVVQPIRKSPGQVSTPTARLIPCHNSRQDVLWNSWTASLHGPLNDVQADQSSRPLTKRNSPDQTTTPREPLNPGYHRNAQVQYQIPKHT